MSDEQNKQAVLEMHAAIARGDIDGMFAPMTDDVTFPPSASMAFAAASRDCVSRVPVKTKLWPDSLPPVIGGRFNISNTKMATPSAIVGTHFLSVLTSSRAPLKISHLV